VFREPIGYSRRIFVLYPSLALFELQAPLAAMQQPPLRGPANQAHSSLPQAPPPPYDATRVPSHRALPHAPPPPAARLLVIASSAPLAVTSRTAPYSDISNSATAARTSLARVSSTNDNSAPDEGTPFLSTSGPQRQSLQMDKSSVVEPVVDPKEAAEKQPRPWFGYLMTVGCIAGMVISLAVGKGFAPLNQNPMFGPSATALVDCGAKVTSLIIAGDWWRLLTPLWLHAGLIHLATNMNMLIRMGWSFERAIGSLRFAGIYLVSGVFSMLYSAIFATQAVTVGASGALFGILGAMLGELIGNCHLLTPKERCCHFTMLGATIAVNLAIGLLPMVDNFAHAFGCLGGLLLGLGFIWHKDYKQGVKFRQVACGMFSIMLFLLLALVAILLLAFKQDANEFCPVCKYISCVPTPWWTCDNAGTATGQSLPGNGTRLLRASGGAFEL